MVWWVEGGVITDQGPELHAFNATLRYHTMPVGEGLGPDVTLTIRLNKPSPCILDIEYAREVEDISQDGEGESEPSL